MKNFTQHIHHMLICLSIVASLSACGTLQIEWQEEASTEAIPETPSFTHSTESGEETRVALEQVTQSPQVPTHTATLVPSPTNTTRPTFTPRPTPTPRPTLAPIDFEALTPITVQNADQLSVMARFELDDASELAWAKDSRSFFILRGDKIQHLDLQERYELAAWTIVPDGAGLEFCSAQSLLVTYFDVQDGIGYEFQIWDLDQGQPLQFLRDERSGIQSFKLVFSSDCSLLAMGVNDGIISSFFRVLDPKSSQEIFSTSDPDPVVRGLAVNAARQQLATGTGTGIFLWDFGQDQPLAEIPLEVSGGFLDGLDPTGRFLALPDFDLRQVQVWDLQSMQLYAGFDGEFQGFSPDGKWMMTSTMEHFMLWDVNSGEQLAEFPAVKSISISPDQTMLLVTHGPGSFEDIVEVWGVPSQ